MTKQALLTLMGKSPVMATATLRAAGIHPRVIAAALEDEIIFRLAHGFVGTLDAYAHPQIDDAIACMKTGGVVARLSAAQRHGLVEAIPDAIELIVPAALRHSPTDLAVRIWRSRTPESLTYGIERHDVFGIEMRITDPARTVVDLWRDRTGHAGDEQHRLTALRAYLSQHDAGPMQDAADVFHVRHRLDTAIAVAIETLKGPML